jgi:dienelactone hydrolase
MFFRRFVFILILPLFVYGAADTTFISGFAPSESGFEGAVTLLSETADGPFGVVEVEVPYRGLKGEDRKGKARLVVHRDQIASGQPIPAFCHVHYEKDAGGAKKWAKRGWGVFTAAYTDNNGDYPIDAAPATGNNQARAIIQWARRLPFIDRRRLHIDGGSQGGYMALAMGAEIFPVTAITADAPVVNWAYNLNYFEVNKPVSKYPASLDDSPLPVVCAVTMLADWSYRSYGDDLSAGAWYLLSPIAWTDRITAPTLITCATGDMLVPMESMTRKHLHPWQVEKFPEGYQRDFDAITRCNPARKVFEACIPEDETHISVVPKQKNSFELPLEMFKDSRKKPKSGPLNQDKPWSPDRQWNLVYCDEGPPNPCAAHTSWEWAMSPDTFVAHYKTSDPAPNLLNAAKLYRLMQRYAGKLENTPLLKDGRPVNRLNYPALEKRDVLTGLADYAATGDAHRNRLEALYTECPLQPLGDRLNTDKLRSLLAGL